jgi:hypothetical protein
MVMELALVGGSDWFGLLQHYPNRPKLFSDEKASSNWLREFATALTLRIAVIVRSQVRSLR